MIELPAEVQNKLLALGDVGARWTAGLGDLVSVIEREWGVQLGATLHGGSEAYVGQAAYVGQSANVGHAADVAQAVVKAGRACVVKLLLPSQSGIEREIQALRIAGGRGYVTLLRYDMARRAMLLEQLGTPLSALGLPSRTQMKIICATLQRSWVQVPEGAVDGDALMTGAAKGTYLRDFIIATWESSGRPCSARAIEQAREFAQARIAAFDPMTSVLVHGDAHSSNTLQVIGAASGDIDAFKLIDPDGLLAEPAYDLAIPMREWSEELLAGDALQLGRERCAYLSWLTDVDAVAIWQWGFLERMSTGLYLLQLGYRDAGLDMLRVAELWAA